jgi:hypothetical protein
MEITTTNKIDISSDTENYITINFKGKSYKITYSYLLALIRIMFKWDWVECDDLGFVVPKEEEMREER